MYVQCNIYVATLILIICSLAIYFTDIVTGVIEDVLRPLLLSVVSSPSSSFITVVNSVIDDVNIVLNGKHHDLKVTIADYFKAVALYYVDEALDSFPFPLSLTQGKKECASKVFFNHIYDNTESAAELIDLFQNISVAVGVIKQVGKTIITDVHMSCSLNSKPIIAIYVHMHIYIAV